MCLGARLLNISALAPLAVLVMALPGNSVSARAANGAPAGGAPQPVVVAIDPGHGGSADNQHPDKPYDPGVVANGVQEKDVTLQVAQRLQHLLEARHVTVVLTRTDDRFVSIETRSHKANQARAQALVSIHVNSYNDPTVGGTVVLYQNNANLGFARTLSDSVGGALGAKGIADNGVLPFESLWQSTNMPTATVELGYLTNPQEAHRLTEAGVQDAFAQGMEQGVEKQLPEIVTRPAEIAQWRVAHPHEAATPSEAATASAPPEGGGAGGWVRLLLVLAMVALTVRHRRRLGTALLALLAKALTREALPRTGRRRLVTHAQRSAQRQTVLTRAQRPAPARSAFDDLLEPRRIPRPAAPVPTPRQSARRARPPVPARVPSAPSRRARGSRVAPQTH